MPVLTTLEQVLSKARPGEPVAVHPVRVEGVVTHVRGALGRWVTIHDGTNGCGLNAASMPATLSPGQRVVVEGELAVEAHYPHIARARVTVVGEGSLPMPAEVSAGDLATGKAHAGWVRLRAGVLDVCRVDGKLIYLLGSSGTTFNAFVDESIDHLPLGRMNATVEVQGVPWSRLSGGSSRPSRFNLHVAKHSLMTIKSPGSTNLWGCPRFTLQKFQAAPVSDDRIVVAGTVTYSSPAGMLTIEDGTARGYVTLMSPIPTDNRRAEFVPRVRAKIRAGDTVEVVTTKRKQRVHSPWLEWAEVRVTGSAPLPDPVSLTPAELLTGKPDCQRVRMRVRVLDYDHHKQGDAFVSRLMVQAGDRTIHAVYAGDRYVDFESMPGREVELTGVPVMSEGTAQAVRAYTFYLGDPADVRVLPPPSAWRDPGTLKIAGSVSAVLLLAGAWIYFLRRQVSMRTAELRTSNERLRQSEQALQSALTQEQEINQLKTSFVSMVSHEFRTPLGVIVSSVDILRRYFDRIGPDMREQQLDIILRSTGTLSGLVEDLLLLGKAEAGKLHCQVAPLDLETFCRGLVDEVASATRRACPIEMLCEGDFTGVAADESLLRPALMNLLSNAVKYSPAGAAVAFEVRRESKDVRFVIRDRGIGIPPNDQPRLFVAFARASNVGNRQGTGLGLVIAKRCVDLHGGRIEFTSALGQGTTFSVILPLFQTNRQPEGAAIPV